jgi:hypothetical protein
MVRISRTKQSTIISATLAFFLVFEHHKKPDGIHQTVYKYFPSSFLDFFALFFGTILFVKKFIELDIPDACETMYKLDGIRTCDQIARAIVCPKGLLFGGC